MCGPHEGMCGTLHGNVLRCELQNQWQMNNALLGEEREVNTRLVQEHHALLQVMNSSIGKWARGIQMILKT